jgi:xylan 1,4-beta-xylosidase
MESGYKSGVHFRVGRDTIPSLLSRWLLALVLSTSFLVPQFQNASAEVFYENPVVPGDHPDPSIIRVGHDYWATATSSEWGPQFQLLHSKDLVNWEIKGVVFPHRPEWATGNFWAPEISQYQGHFYVYYVGREKDGPLGVAVATADNPAGPYTDHGPLIAQADGSIDPVPTTDENGKRYLVWKEDGNSANRQTILWAQPLNEDGTKLIGQPTELIRNDAGWEGSLVEGPFVLRRGNWFYLFYSGNGCCGPGCNYALGVARSHSLLGPWEKNPANPIVAGNEHWKCPGHGSIVADDRGRCWLLYHAYSVTGSVFTGREAILDEVKFRGDDNWPSIDDGKGPSAKAISPFGAAQRKNGLNFVDNFGGSQLRPDWQWPQDNEPVYKLQHGQLLLSARPDRGTNVLGAVLARPTTAPDYVATAIVDVADLKPGCLAGLWAFGDGANAIGVTAGEGKLMLWRREKGWLSRLVEVDAPATAKLRLRLTATQGFRFHFLASADGVKWIPIGDDLIGRNLPPWDRSIRVALTAGGEENAEARFTEFRIIQTVQ